MPRLRPNANALLVAAVNRCVSLVRKVRLQLKILKRPQKPQRNLRLLLVVGV